MSRKLTAILFFAALVAVTLADLPNCHPQCAWKCDDPRCDAICEPVCEPPKCHTSCQEPKNAVCDVKCEKPDCKIWCPDKACESQDCPKCINSCQQPHCVTHCQVPKPVCEAVCQEPNCDWKCHKPECPKPKCELVCENPGCRPQVECCKCEGQIPALVATAFPIFKETEKEAKCCKCNEGQAPKAEATIHHNVNPAAQQAAADPTLGGTIFTEKKTHYSVNPTDKPVRIGPSYYEKPKALIKRIEAPTA